MFVTASFIGTRKNDMNYLFFLLTEDYIESHRRMMDDLDPLLKKFAMDIGSAGALVRPFPGDEFNTRMDVLRKSWSDSSKEKICRTPGILFINVDFDLFDPQQDQWFYFSLRDVMDQFGRVSIFELHEFFSTLTEACICGYDVFQVANESIGDKLLQEFYDSFELKPGIFGFNMDLKNAHQFIKSLVKAVK